MPATKTGSACNGSTAVNGIPLDKHPWPFQWLNAMYVTEPNVVVLLAGRWEEVDLEYQGKWTNNLNPVLRGLCQAS